MVFLSELTFTDDLHQLKMLTEKQAANQNHYIKGPTANQSPSTEDLTNQNLYTTRDLIANQSQFTKDPTPNQNHHTK